MVLVTPYVVRAVRRTCRVRTTALPVRRIRRPILLGSINRIYGVPGRTGPGRNYRGTYGFITD